MPTVSGQSIVFGFDDADAPTGIAGFFAKTLDIADEPEVVEYATDGFGQVIAAAASIVGARIKTATFTGYIDKDSFVAKTAAVGTLIYKGSPYFVKTVGKPLMKGKFAEVPIETEFLPLAQS